MTVFTATETTLSEQQSVSLVEAWQHLQLGKTWGKKINIYVFFFLFQNQEKLIVFSGGLDLGTLEHKTHRATSCN